MLGTTLGIVVGSDEVAGTTRAGGFLTPVGGAEGEREDHQPRSSPVSPVKSDWRRQAIRPGAAGRRPSPCSGCATWCRSSTTPFAKAASPKNGSTVPNSTTLAEAECAPDDVGRFARANLGYIEDVLESLDWTRGTEEDFVDEDEEPAWPGFAQLREPIRNPWRHVGRNDPCPCGSGKKAKKCCLANGEPPV